MRDGNAISVCVCVCSFVHGLDKEIANFELKKQDNKAKNH